MQNYSIDCDHFNAGTCNRFQVFNKLVHAIKCIIATLAKSVFKILAFTFLN